MYTNLNISQLEQLFDLTSEIEQEQIKFGDTEENTLNYNIRVLGRKGVLVLNFIAGMESIYMKTSGQAEIWFNKLSKLQIE